MIDTCSVCVISVVQDKDRINADKISHDQKSIAYAHIRTCTDNIKHSNTLQKSEGVKVEPIGSYKSKFMSANWAPECVIHKIKFIGKIKFLNANWTL